MTHDESVPRGGKVPNWSGYEYETELMPGESADQATERMKAEGRTEYLIWPTGKKGVGSPVAFQTETKKRLKDEEGEG